VSGTGVAPIQHNVTISWTASTSPVVGYNVFRSTTSGTNYVLLNATRVIGLTYTDNTVQSGLTYYYVVTSVASNGTQSINSSQVAVTVPSP
jgi:fibronectin type 3 domain-containing protein